MKELRKILASKAIKFMRDFKDLYVAFRFEGDYDRMLQNDLLQTWIWKATKIIGRNRKIPKEVALQCADELLNFHLAQIAPVDEHVENFVKDLNTHTTEYSVLSDYIQKQTGTRFIFMYNPLLLWHCKSSICSAIDLGEPHLYLLVYNDIFKNLSFIYKKCLALHEVGHIHYRHIQKIAEQVRCTGEPVNTHKNFCPAHRYELEADDYAASIIGNKPMRRVLLHIYATKLTMIKKILKHREFMDRLKELK